MEPAPEQLQVHDVVKVVSVAEPTDWVGADEAIGRPPRAGDEGRVVARDRTGGRVVVEMCHPSGHRVWQATFSSCDLRLVWRSGR